MKKKKNKRMQRMHIWITAGALVLAAVAILFVTYYSGSLSLTTFQKTTRVDTTLTCSISGNTLQAQVGVTGSSTVSFPTSKLNSFHVRWSIQDHHAGEVSPETSVVQTNGLATTTYTAQKSDTTNTVQASFAGGRDFSSHTFYKSSGCEVKIPAFTVSATPTPAKGTARPTSNPTITPIKDPTPAPTLCPAVCRKVGNTWKCGC